MKAPSVDVLGDGRTIVAIATPPGRGALALIRISGKDACRVAGDLLTPPLTQVRRATRVTIRDARGETIDEAMATFYASPRSYTGEDLVEISTHGGMVVPTAVVAAAIQAGAREAEPGEFTRRAVLNGKLDLLQAEAIADLIEARSNAAHHLALRQLDGGLSRRLDLMRTRLLQLEAMLAYDIDFPEEDDGPVPRTAILETAREIREALGALLATSEHGALVHEGALVVLIGMPNVGKSSLFNALLGEARAIVTEVPGTTRDAIEAVLDLPGWPLRLVDTAGLRETLDPVERLGIETTKRYLQRAAVVVTCADTENGHVPDDEIALHTTAPVIRVATKGDVRAPESALGSDVIVSAHDGQGLKRLLEIIESRLIERRGQIELDAPTLTRARHRVAVARASDEVDQFIGAWADSVLPAPVAAVHIRAAEDALAELIGSVHVEHVLEVVFRTFCVGK